MSATYSMSATPTVLSVNVGAARPTPHSSAGFTGIDKRPQQGPVKVEATIGASDSGVAGDVICDVRHHGGPDQAVYAYAREDLDDWQRRLERELPSGMFGENLTTVGLDVTGAVIGERWRIGDRLLLEVTAPRIPCRTFAGWLAEHEWIKMFTDWARPGAYFRVIEPGPVEMGDRVAVIERPRHDATIGVAFRALTREPDLLPLLLDADALPESVKERVRRRMRIQNTA